MEFESGKSRCAQQVLNNPGICAGYRLFTSSGSVAYFPTVSPTICSKCNSSRDGISEEEAREFRDSRAGQRWSSFLKGAT